MRSDVEGLKVWQSDTSYVGPLEVRRPLPTRSLQSVGPFVLLDHFGPVPAPAEKLPAHPHAGIEVMTYLLDGANEHMDSAGNVGQIGAGGAQWMKSGRGILHTERNLLEKAKTMHGLQIWARQPVEQQDDPPEYAAVQASDMTRWVENGCELCLLAGELSGREGPIPIALPSLMIHIKIPGGAQLKLPLPDRNHEYGVYIISNSLVLNEQHDLPEYTFTCLPPGSESAVLSATENPGEVFLLGGKSAPKPLVFGGSFVLDSKDAIDEANRRFRSGEMGQLDGVPF